MTRIALMGAGGKMGVRLSKNLIDSPYDVEHIEISEAGRERLAQKAGLQSVAGTDNIGEADVVLLAVPDRMIGKIAHSIIDDVKPGAALVVLDAAAPYAGEMPKRDDVTYFCSHPCHPPIFDFTPDEAVQRDFFGGIDAPQGIVCALIQGPEEHYALCEDIAKRIYGPVSRSHRCTLEQIAILEPALSESVGATMCMALREAADKAEAMGVPKDAAHDFLLGHMKILLAIAFDIFPEGKLSDGAIHAVNQAKPRIFKEDWLDNIFSTEAVRQSVIDICHPEGIDT
ncbi:phosphogluconate dehydrogenase C-terminal domain-containing protein [Thalassococcus lentus]|uniref:NAD(P)-binding domain-containing protein n=1 Tax=Thalassococcus lentus TaxID=1210524 RepID=A0ABT4XQQ1_9RHOB|nr:phosphogluconate dehydrogenase C-terminal domain-containing protein [Thalassococcus lentus]MDA7424282.1 NAD(P)-binding domain-containing protein [Thalassococcus lentus]